MNGLICESGRNENKQAFLGKRATGGTHEIAFELRGSGSVREGNGSFDAPWSEFCRMLHLAGVVPTQTVFEIVTQANIKVSGSGLALKDVNVAEFQFPGLACRGVVRALPRRYNEARLRPRTGFGVAVFVLAALERRLVSFEQSSNFL